MMEEGNVVKLVFFVLVAVAVSCFAMWCFGYASARDDYEEQAIKHGFAEYRCDPVKGRVKFTWKVEAEKR